MPRYLAPHRHAGEATEAAPQQLRDARHGN